MRFRLLYTCFLIFSVISLTISCSGRKSRAEHKDIIPEKDLITILSDVYITDGLLSIPKVVNGYDTPDSLKAYINMIEKHGYTKSQMDRTMRYYFIRQPKKLIKIYDKVLGRLSEMESRLLKRSPSLADPGGNLWKGESIYASPGPRVTDTAGFDFPAGYSRFYTLSFTITLFPDDQTINPRPGVYIQTADTAKSKKRVFFPSFLFVRDGYPHHYRGSVTVTEPPPLKIKGWFIDLENQSPFTGKHYIIENILLTPDKLRE